MGIKFYCPNGHKLNVKSFLSGKRALCPKCGARLVVPSIDESEALAAGAGASSERSASQLSGPTSSHEIPLLSSASAATMVPPALGDAISEAPDATWYVRPATGGQFGPAPAETMRAWLSEGRIGASSMVWRDGWSDWRAAGVVFPQLAGLSGSGFAPALAAPPPTAGQSARQVGVPPPIAGSLPQGQVVQTISVAQPQVGAGRLSTGMPPLAESVRKRRRRHDARLYASALLVVASVILSIVLAVVFSRGRDVEPEDAPEKSAATDKAPAQEPDDPLLPSS
jgi:hypothetical protein